jgi:microcompartment protein CcmL/EutN
MEPPQGEALGLVETLGLVAGIEACDAMLKAANVRLLSIERTDPAMMTVKILGETAAVRAACDAGQAAAERVGKVFAVHVIPRPSDEVRRLLLDEPASPAPPPRARQGGASGGKANPGESGLEDLTVKELRDIARQHEDFPLRGREISRATKEHLIELLRSK